MNNIVTCIIRLTKKSSVIGKTTFLIFILLISGCSSDCQTPAVHEKLKSYLSSIESVYKINIDSYDVDSHDIKSETGESCRASFKYQMPLNDYDSIKRLSEFYNGGFFITKPLLKGFAKKEDSEYKSAHAAINREIEKLEKYFRSFSFGDNNYPIVATKMYIDFNIIKSKTLEGVEQNETGKFSIKGQKEALISAKTQLKSIDSDLFNIFDNLAKEQGYLGGNDKMSLEDQYHKEYLSLGNIKDKIAQFDKKARITLENVKRSIIRVKALESAKPLFELKGDYFKTFRDEFLSYLDMDKFDIDVTSVKTRGDDMLITAKFTSRHDDVIGNIYFEGLGNNETIGTYELGGYVHFRNGIAKGETVEETIYIDGGFMGNKTLALPLYRRAKKHAVYLQAMHYEGGKGDKYYLKRELNGKEIKNEFISPAKLLAYIENKHIQEKRFYKNLQQNLDSLVQQKKELKEQIKKSHSIIRTVFTKIPSNIKANLLVGQDLKDLRQIPIRQVEYVTKT